MYPAMTMGDESSGFAVLGLDVDLLVDHVRFCFLILVLGAGARHDCKERRARQGEPPLREQQLAPLNLSFGIAIVMSVTINSQRPERAR